MKIKDILKAKHNSAHRAAVVVLDPENANDLKAELDGQGMVGINAPHGPIYSLTVDGTPIAVANVRRPYIMFEGPTAPIMQFL